MLPNTDTAVPFSHTQPAGATEQGPPTRGCLREDGIGRQVPVESVGQPKLRHAIQHDPIALRSSEGVGVRPFSRFPLYRPYLTLAPPQPLYSLCSLWPIQTAPRPTT